MKTLIISDTHLGKKFDLKKFQYLSRIIKQADKVILNGDFWEGYELSFDEFLSSEWRGLFSDLKRANTIYVSGNHDLYEWINVRQAKIFCDDVVQEFSMDIDGRQALIQHGHLIAPSAELTNKFLAKPFFLNLGNSLEMIMVKIFGKGFLRWLYSSCNKTMIQWQAENMSEDELLITGHSHLQSHEGNFYNGGFCKHGYAQYIWIEDGEITMVDERYD